MRSVAWPVNPRSSNFIERSDVTLFHAVVLIDHQQAEILQFDAEHVEAEKVRASTRHTRQHGSAVRSEHEYYAHVCDALEGIA